MKKIIKEIRKVLEKKSNPETKQCQGRFFKENVKIYGVKSAVVAKIGRDYFKKIKNKNKKEIFSLCEELWQSGFMEESFIACNWSYFIHKDYSTDDFEIFEKWVNKYVSNWASCDSFCNHTIGAFLEIYPQYIVRLKAWTKSKNRWLKRASAVSLIIPARNGKYLKDIFQIADSLLTDKDDMVQKGYGWLLKEASKKHQKEVFNYVIKNKKIMPRTALRYAIEKMPANLKKKAMVK
jgi:3-methyladenine DNA glycosylase AlkD